MSGFISLVTALNEWFDTPLADLPNPAQARVRQDFSPMPWDSLSAEQRRSVARQWDYNHDPATDQDRQYWWDFFIKKDELEEQIEQWRTVATATAGELAEKERRLKELADELARMQRIKEHGRGDYLPASSLTNPSSRGRQNRYIAYPKALHKLRQRLDATPEELAAWIFRGPDNGGIAAYRNANELAQPPRFYFDYSMGEDYLAPMMFCWFLADDVDHFDPAVRYITGQALIERWAKQPGIQPKAFIQAKVEESRLLDLHPAHGGTRGTFSEYAAFPLLESGLFALAHIEAIETEDFGECEDTESHASVSPCQAVGASDIWRYFSVVSEPGENIDWWKAMMREAKRNGLVECRVGDGKRGPGGSLWRPDLVAAWLVDRHTKNHQGLGSSAVRSMLKRFPGCAEVAETMFPSDE